MTEEDKLIYIHNLYKKKLNCGKSLLELTTYDNIAMWWVADTPFHDLVSKAIDNEVPPDRSNQHKLIASIYNHHELFMKFYRNIGIYIVMMYDIFIMLLVRLMIKISGKSKQDKKNTKPKILFIAQDRQWRVIKDCRTNCLKKSDAFFDSLIIKLNNRYNLIGIYPIDLYPIRGLKIFRDKLKNWNIPHKPLNLYWSMSAWRKERKAFKHFKKSWHYLIRDKVFKEMCIYDEKDLYKEIKDELDLYFSVLFPHLIKYIQIARTMIRVERPNLILLLNEHWWWERTLVIAAKLENIPTLAIQHGIVHPLHKSYRYTKDEIAPDGGVESPYCPIPDKTAVYGPYYKEILTMVSAYPLNSVVVTGQPRYDILYHADKIYSKEEFLRKYNISPNHKIILWATQCHGLSDSENIKNFKAVFETMQNIKNTTLIIKQHPVEGKRYTKMIKRHMDNYKINTLLTPQKLDTYKLLYVCDLMITRHSTTAMEAVILNKPVIILNLSGEPDPVEYVKESVAIGVYKEGELKPAIERLLKDDSELVRNRKKYIRKYLYKIDGNATERVAKVVAEMILEDTR
ncbi:CDP-glycerol glycerophosphotransferase family protein [candidate division WOR-3 bacterium]|nr:CDP-glycerol glycerophosphotransferase family protein [candidate division WOR-3 bacterium]